MSDKKQEMRNPIALNLLLVTHILLLKENL